MKHTYIFLIFAFILGCATVRIPPTRSLNEHEHELVLITIENWNVLLSEINSRFPETSRFPTDPYIVDESNCLNEILSIPIWYPSTQEEVYLYSDGQRCGPDWTDLEGTCPSPNATSVLGYYTRYNNGIRYTTIIPSNRPDRGPGGLTYQECSFIHETIHAIEDCVSFPTHLVRSENSEANSHLESYWPRIMLYDFGCATI